MKTVCTCPSLVRPAAIVAMPVGNTWPAVVWRRIRTPAMRASVVRRHRTTIQSQTGRDLREHPVRVRRVVRCGAESFINW